MSRMHLTDGELVPFTSAEEEAEDAKAAAWNAGGRREAQLNELRRERAIKLIESDWTQATDSPLTDEVKASWTTYRQQLRDLPATTDDPANPTWPVAP